MFARHGTFHVTFPDDELAADWLNARESCQERGEVVKLKVCLVELYKCLGIVKQ